jgi:hypothetical protein
MYLPFGLLQIKSRCPKEVKRLRLYLNKLLAVSSHSCALDHVYTRTTHVCARLH